jgi:phosphoribosylglycinamide formyltransferase-1
VEKSPDPLGILISGRGSNMRAIVEATRSRRLHAHVAVVISNRADAKGLDFARESGVDTWVISHRDYGTREAFDAALAAALNDHGVKLVCLAGFMRLLGSEFLAAFPNAVLNIHPSLLPAFPGEHAVRQAIEHGVKVSGATVHFVTSDLDSGPILVQEAVPVLEGDDEHTLAARILTVEHRLYPEAIRRVLAGGWRISGRRVVWDG